LLIIGYESEQNPIILFDDVCNLCNGTVNFLLKHDRKKQFHFAPIHSEVAQLLFRKFQIPVETDSVILIKSNKVYFESDAAIEIAGMLTFPLENDGCFQNYSKKNEGYIFIDVDCKKPLQMVWET
jgi:predicted DCC family thiol-disulfide oxidoreductase YuxK